MEEMQCSVNGIINKECKTQVKNAVGKIKGVQEVGVNFTTGTVQVKYNKPATKNEIKDCIENTGFKIVYE